VHESKEKAKEAEPLVSAILEAYKERILPRGIAEKGDRGIT